MFIFYFASICLYPKFTSDPKLLRCDFKERSYISWPHLFYNEPFPHRCFPISWDRKHTQSNSYWSYDSRVQFGNDLGSTRARGHSFTGSQVPLACRRKPEILNLRTFQHKQKCWICLGTNSIRCDDKFKWV